MICLFGGTFDPVHVGHVHAARRVGEALDLPEVRLLLAARPGHRDQPGAAVGHRWRMLELACANEARLVPDDSEVRRAERAGRPSYTVETLEAYRAKHPGAGLIWVVGSDAYRELPTWHRWRDIFTLANLVVLQRPGADRALPEPLNAEHQARCSDMPPRGAAGSVLLLDAPMLDVSATEVRRRLAAGDPGVADLLTSAVYTYIRKHHLYGVIGDA